jgi:hypothetical protein
MKQATRRTHQLQKQAVRRGGSSRAGRAPQRRPPRQTSRTATVWAILKTHPFYFRGLVCAVRVKLCVCFFTRGELELHTRVE